MRYAAPPSRGGPPFPTCQPNSEPEQVSTPRACRYSPMDMHGIQVLQKTEQGDVQYGRTHTYPLTKRTRSKPEPVPPTHTCTTAAAQPQALSVSPSKPHHNINTGAAPPASQCIPALHLRCTDHPFVTKPTAAAGTRPLQPSRQQLHRPGATAPVGARPLSAAMSSRRLDWFHTLD